MPRTLTHVKLLAAMLLASAALAAEPEVIPLWPGAAPGSESWSYPEGVITMPEGRGQRVVNVTRPVLLAFLPERSKANGTAVVVCPGGGFRRLATDIEGTNVARWLNSLGVAAFVFKYRIIRTGDEGEKDPAVMAERRKEVIPLAVADGQQAIRLVRSRASGWGLRADRIGMMGFSAGGFVTAAVAMHHDPGSRPDFAAPIYAALPEDLTVPSDAPPLFLVHAGDDTTVPVLGSTIRMYTAWKQAGVPAEVHIYPQGGHGFGMGRPGLTIATWPDRFRDWLDAQGLLKPAQ